jgi:hypothetical protein
MNRTRKPDYTRKRNRLTRGQKKAKSNGEIAGERLAERLAAYDDYYARVEQIYREVLASY